MFELKIEFIGRKTSCLNLPLCTRTVNPGHVHDMAQHDVARWPVWVKEDAQRL